MADKRLGVGFVGSGFNARFHLQGLQAVRDVDVLGVWSPNLKHADDMAAQARRLDLGPAKAHRSIAEMVADPGVDALWLCGPNQARVENVEEIVDAMTRGKGTLKGVACEKPLARNVAEAVRVTEMVKKAGLAHGYLENQLFAPAVAQGRAIVLARSASLTGRPYLARAAGEHSGPHMPWFWRGAALLRLTARPRVLDVVELAREPAQAVLQSRGERAIRRRPGRKAERGDGAHARHLGRGGGVRLRGRGPAFRARVPRARSAAADLRRRRRGREAADDGLHERRAGEDGRSEERRVGKECRSRWSPYH